MVVKGRGGRKGGEGGGGKEGPTRRRRLIGHPPAAAAGEDCRDGAHSEKGGASRLGRGRWGAAQRTTARPGACPYRRHASGVRTPTEPQPPPAPAGPPLPPSAPPPHAVPAAAPAAHLRARHPWPARPHRHGRRGGPHLPRPPPPPHGTPPPGLHFAPHRREDARAKAGVRGSQSRARGWGTHPPTPVWRQHPKLTSTLAADGRLRWTGRAADGKRRVWSARTASSAGTAVMRGTDDGVCWGSTPARCSRNASEGSLWSVGSPHRGARKVGCTVPSVSRRAVWGTYDTAQVWREEGSVHRREPPQVPHRWWHTATAIKKRASGAAARGWTVRDRCHLPRQTTTLTTNLPSATCMRREWESSAGVPLQMGLE